MSRPIRIRSRPIRIRGKSKRIDRATYTKMAPTLKDLTNKLLKVNVGSIPDFDSRNVQLNVMNKERLLQTIRKKEQMALTLKLDV